MSPVWRALLVVLVCSACAAHAFDLSTVESDEEGVAELQGAVSTGWSITKKDKTIVMAAMERGFWRTAEELILHSKTVRADMTHAVYKSASSIRKRLKVLEEALSKRKKVSKGIPPAFEWAQSPDSIFLNVKFAHKLDTPATLGCKASNVSITAKAFTFIAECKSKRKVFELKFTPLKEFDGEASSWTMASVGRAVFTLKKSRNATWARLLKSHKKPSNMHVWWSMKEKYAKEMEEFAKVESKLRQETKDAEAKAKAEENTQQAASGTEGTTGTAEDTAAEAPVEAEPPAPSAFDIKKAELEKEFRQKKKDADAKRRSEITAIDKKARADKLEAMNRAHAEKAAIAKRAAEERQSATKRCDEAKRALDEQLADEVAALQESLKEL